MYQLNFKINKIEGKISEIIYIIKLLFSFLSFYATKYYNL